jgi:DNA repair protein RadA/Sms
MIFSCSKCDSQFSKWLGQCPQCGAWGTIDSSGAESLVKRKPGDDITQVMDFSQIKAGEAIRFKTNLEEIDRVLGGGFIPGTMILIGGQPGVGKSTLVLQIAGQMKGKTIFYVSGEESAQQIKTRIDRLECDPGDWKFFGETDIEIISETLEKHQPDMVIIDSIQTMVFSGLDSEAGSVNQVRACTAKLRSLAKKIKTTILIIGHVTKEGIMAGPKTLEHLVDVVLSLDGDPESCFRFLRAIKNRFGSTNEVGVFEMKKQGLVEVKNPSLVFLANRNQQVAGSAVVPVVEGSRSFLIEIQALVSRTAFGYPQRKSSGFDLNRLNLIIAVLIKRCGFNLLNQDVHINIVGGLTISEPAVDLGVALAVVSAFKNKPIISETAVFGEIGLAGEVRGVGSFEKRINESEKMGFKNIICPENKKTTVINKDTGGKIKIIQVESLNQAIEKTIS